MLRDLGEASPWREVVDEYTGDQASFHERHYNEFVTFLPYVQRFLYGEGRSRRERRRQRLRRRRCACSAATTSRRCAWSRGPATRRSRSTSCMSTCTSSTTSTWCCSTSRSRADDLPLAQAQELLYRFGRAYPAGWDAQGQALHCLASVEWLGADGQVLASSDAQQRDAFLAHVAEHRAPRIAAHWAFLLAAAGQRPLRRSRARCATARSSTTACR